MGAPRPAGLRLILLYKFVKAPLVLLAAAWLLLAPRQASAAGWALAAALSEHGALLMRAGRWLGLHLTDHALHAAALLAALDGASTLVEGLLLLSGKPWAEWIVVASLSALLPFEVAAIAHHPSAVRIAALLINLAIVIYLARRRLRS